MSKLSPKDFKRELMLSMKIDNGEVESISVGTTNDILLMFAIFIHKTAEDEQKDPNELLEMIRLNLNCILLSNPKEEAA